eukprot:Clim_evm103s225 gene=Clim_evmTU103s225
MNSIRSSHFCEYDACAAPQVLQFTGEDHNELELQCTQNETVQNRVTINAHGQFERHSEFVVTVFNASTQESIHQETLTLPVQNYIFIADPQVDCMVQLRAAKGTLAVFYNVIMDTAPKDATDVASNQLSCDTLPLAKVLNQPQTNCDNGLVYCNATDADNAAAAGSKETIDNNDVLLSYGSLTGIILAALLVGLCIGALVMFIHRRAQLRSYAKQVDQVHGTPAQL